MKKIVPLLLTLLLTLPAFAQTLSPEDQKNMAILAMSQTPLVGMDKESSLFIAAKSYECAAYYVAMTIVAQQLHEGGRLGEGFGSLEDFTSAGQQIGAYHMALAEIIHIIYDVTDEQDAEIMHAQGEKVRVVINSLQPMDIDDKYEIPCKAILKTYLPTIFKEEEKNGA